MLNEAKVKLLSPQLFILGYMLHWVHVKYSETYPAMDKSVEKILNKHLEFIKIKHIFSKGVYCESN